MNMINIELVKLNNDKMNISIKFMVIINVINDSYVDNGIILIRIFIFHFSLIFTVYYSFDQFYII